MKGIAIIGMAGRFPGAPNVSTFWQNLCAGTESIRDVSERELTDAPISQSIWSQPNFVRRAAFPEGVELFDASFFGFTPTESAIVDPQHRVLLECANEALEDAAYDSARYSGAIGVFAGSALNTYLLTHLLSASELLDQIDPVQLNLASSGDFLATRISYKLNLRGPSQTVQSACSTSLVAVHQACQSLLSGESDMALAGGVALNFRLRHGYPSVAGGMFSEKGKCRAFDREADGTVFGSGAAMVLLKRYEEAARDRDHIYAVIRGSAVNNDGSAKVGYTAPSIEGQARVITEALANAGVSAESIGYVETHGTGTALGDPIEIQALSRAFGTQGRRGQCAIGSVKTNIGHLDCAAGVASLIKLAKMLWHKEIPASLNFTSANPQIEFEKTPFRVNTRLTGWEESEYPRRAGISAFGVGGTNAHMILEEAPAGDTTKSSRRRHLFIQSTATESALRRSALELEAYLGEHPEVSHADAAFSLAVGRRELPWRLYSVNADMSGRGKNGLPESKWIATKAATTPPPVVFMFPGEDSLITRIDDELYQSESVFRKELDNCLQIIADGAKCDRSELLSVSAAELSARTDLAQPLLFAFEYALAQLWVSWGVEPAGMIGHGLGEYVAACLAGSLRLEDALGLVVPRGRLMEAMPAGAMLSVPLSEYDAGLFVDDQIKLAAVNGPSQCVLAGTTEAIDYLQGRLTEDGLNCRRLPGSRAIQHLSHSALTEFERYASAVSLKAPKVPWASNVTGTWIRAEEAVDPGYWVRHCRETVRFFDNLQQAHALPNVVFLEIGPQPVLQQMATRLPLAARSQIALSCFDVMSGGYGQLLTAAGELWSRGVRIDWATFYQHEQAHRVSLPTYPFERQRCWVERRNSGRTGHSEPSRASAPATDVRPPASISMHARPRLSRPYVAPCTATEIRLTSILEPVFGIRPVGARDNFFELGADSLMAVNLVAQLRSSFGVELTAAHVYEGLDVQSLASIIDEMILESSQGELLGIHQNTTLEDSYTYTN